MLIKLRLIICKNFVLSCIILFYIFEYLRVLFFIILIISFFIEISKLIIEKYK